MSALQAFPPGQQAILRSFAKHGPTSIYVPSDILDLRVCWAMAERGILQRYEEDGFTGYELTSRGVAVLAPPPADPGPGSQQDADGGGT